MAIADNQRPQRAILLPPPEAPLTINCRSL